MEKEQATKKAGKLSTVDLLLVSRTAQSAALSVAAQE